MRLTTQALRMAAAAPSGPVALLDWSVDLTFSRASAATHWDGTTFRRFASGAARILPSGALCVGGARTNYAQNSSITSAYVSNGTAMTPAAVAGPDGTTVAASITDTGGGGRYAGLVAGAPSSGVMSASIFAKRTSADGTIKIGVNPFGASDVTVAFGSAWARRQAQITRSGTGYFTFSANTRLCQLWGAQAEVGAFAGEHIEVSGTTAVTRLADDARVLSAAVPARLRNGRWATTITPKRASTQANDTSTDTLFAFGSGTDNRIYLDSSNRIVVRVGGVDVVTTGALTWSSEQAITLTFDAAAGTIAVSGATTGNGTTTGTAWTMPTGDMQVGNTSALAAAFFGLLTPPVTA